MNSGDPIAVGVVLYVDVKTDRLDLMVAALEAPEHAAHALVRDDLSSLIQAAQLTPDLRWLVPVEHPADLDAVAVLPGLAFVEIAQLLADPELGSAAQTRGWRVQQDVFAGDLSWIGTGSTEGWKAFVDAGVQLLQTDRPDVLVQVLAEAAKGEWPETW